MISLTSLIFHSLSPFASQIHFYTIPIPILSQVLQPRSSSLCTSKLTHVFPSYHSHSSMRPIIYNNERTLASRHNRLRCHINSQKQTREMNPLHLSCTN